MASFPIHLSVAIVTSGICAISLLVSGLVAPSGIAFYFALGILGGLAPDLDSNNSTPFRVGCELLSLIAASLLVFNLGNRFSVVELFFLWLAAFFVLRYGLFYIFTALTVHRGVFHSIPMAVLFGFLATITLHRFGGIGSFQSWVAGMFVILGYLTHLILDEIYSIDFYGVSIKSSFGTALKLFAPRSPIASILLYLALAVSWKFTPDIQLFLNTFSKIIF
ncbi:inner membrane protein [Gammaproteobacteria bacterium]